MKPRIGVFALGGTIAMVKGEAGGVRPGLGAEDLAAAVPELPSLCELRLETIAKLGSPNITVEAVFRLAARIEELARAGGIDGAVVTQGTDTIEETSFLLDCLLDLAIPVSVIGAMRNPLMTSPDGPGNLLAAVRVVVDPWVRERARELGVLVTMLDSIHAAQEVVKANSHRIDAFASPHGGPIGTVIEDRIRIAAMPLRPHVQTMRRAIGPSPASRLADRSASVGLLNFALDDSGALLRAVAQAADRLGYGGFVLGLMGGGHAPERLVEEIEALARAIPVVGCGRMGNGALLRKTYEMGGAELDLQSRGLIWGGRLHPLKARLLLNLLLRAGAPLDQTREVFESLN
jgi:L-asparaginase